MVIGEIYSRQKRDKIDRTLGSGDRESAGNRLGWSVTPSPILESSTLCFEVRGRTRLVKERRVGDSRRKVIAVDSASAGRPVDRMLGRSCEKDGKGVGKAWESHGSMRPRGGCQGIRRKQLPVTELTRRL